MSQITEKYSHAHRLGDEYYEFVSQTLRSQNLRTDECLQKALGYLDALTELKEDLLNEKPIPVSILRHTLSFLDLVYKDIEAYSDITASHDPGRKLLVESIAAFEKEYGSMTQEQSEATDR